MKDKIILEKLKNTRDKALAQYSKFRVGALILTDSGEIFTGHNIESSSYGLTICAERVALFKALSEGARSFKQIYILAENNEFCPPCGACRQLLMDYAPDIEVVLVTDNGKKEVYQLKSLLPHAFTQSDLLKKTTSAK